MLHLVLGRAGVGKSAYLRERMARTAPEKRVLLVTPEQFTFESQRAVLDLPRAVSERIRVTSFTGLAAELTGAYLPGAKPAADAAAQSVLMSLALEDLSEELTVFDRCAGRPASVRELVNTMTELARCGVDGDALRRAADLSGSDILEDKAKELALISRRYGDLLRDAYTDGRYTLDDAARLIRWKRPYADCDVYLDEFYGFTEQEYGVIASLLATCGDVYAAVCADPARDGVDSAGPLSYTAATVARLRELAGEGECAPDVTLVRERAEVPPEIRALEQYIYEPGAPGLDADAPAVRLTVCADVRAECDCIARAVKRLVRAEGYRYRDIAVIDRAGDVARQLPFSLRKYGVPVFEDTRRALEGDILVRFAECALRLTCSFDTQTVLTMLKTGLYGMEEDDIALLEEYAAVWRVEGPSWRTAFTRNPDGYGAEETDETRARLEKLNALRKSVSEPIGKLAASIDGATGAEGVRALFDFLVGAGAPALLERRALALPDRLRWMCERSWDVLTDVLDRFAAVTRDRVLTKKRFAELFRVMTAGADVGDMPAGMDELTVGQADRIRTSGKKVVFVCGLCHGKFPLANTPSFVLTDGDRRALARHGVTLADDGARLVQRERFLVYSAISTPTERLYLSRSRAEDSGEELQPSEVVSMVRGILPRAEETEDAADGPVERIESLESAFETVAERLRDRDAFTASGDAYLASTPMAPAMRAAHRAASDAPFAFDDPARAAALFGRDMHISPSRVEDYYSCPFKYFLKFGLDARALRRAQLDGALGGTVIHEILERVVADASWVGRSPAELKALVHEYAQDFIDRRMGGEEAVTQRELSALRRAERTALDALLRLMRERDLSEFVTRDVELPIGEDCDVKPYELTLGDGGRVALHGVVDRVDVMETGGRTFLRVVDYKTYEKELQIADVLDGLSVQMLIYLICLCQDSVTRYGEDVIPAGVMYVPAVYGKNKLERGATPEEIEKTRMEQGRMNGLLLDDPDVLHGTDSSGEGFLFKKTKNGGNVITLRQFRLLHRAIDEIVRSMGEELHRGRVEASPHKQKGGYAPCERCDYRAVCGREGSDCAEPDYKDPWETLEERYAE